MAYDLNNIVEKFIKYNDCKGCSSICYIKADIEKNTFKYGINLGSFVNMVPETFVDYFEDIYKSQKAIGFAPNVGTSLSILSKRDNKNKMITFELMYSVFTSKLLPSRFKSHISSINLSVINRKIFSTNSKLKVFSGYGVKIAPNIVGIRDSKKEKFDLKTNNLNLFGLGEIGVEIRKISLMSRVNLGIFSNKVFTLDYRNVAEANNTFSISRVNGQIILGYNF